jgi:hypothetical protein
VQLAACTDAQKRLVRRVDESDRIGPADTPPKQPRAFERVEEHHLIWTFKGRQARQALAGM